MGRIVKAATDPAATVRASAEEVGAVLVAARLEANRERAEARGAAVVLARKMAERIIGHAVEVEPAVMREIVTRAVQAAEPGRRPVLLRVHPADASRLRAELPEWLERLDTEATVQLVEDPTVGRYGCVVETAVARLDARLETQLDALERVLRASGSLRGTKGAQNG